MKNLFFLQVWEDNLWYISTTHDMGMSQNLGTLVNPK